VSLPNQLHHLERANLVNLIQSRPEVEYLFRHALIQNAAYGSLLLQHRRQLHQAVAEKLEQLYPAQEQLAPILAHHFAAAGSSKRAFPYFIQAGDTAARAYANAEAAAHYAQALELTSELTVSDEQFGYLGSHYGRILEHLGRHDEALAAYQQMEQVACQHGNRPLELQALILRATIHSTPTARYDISQAQALSEKALALARELNDETAEAKILWNLFLAVKFVGNWPQVIIYSEQAAALARRLNLREQLAYILNDAFPGYLFTGQIARAWAMIEEAQALWRELDNLPMLADNLISTAYLHGTAGNYEQALAQAQEGHQIALATGNLWGQSNSLGQMAFAHLAWGDFRQAIEELERASAIGEQVGFALATVAFPSQLALIYDELGITDKSSQLVQKALSNIEQLPAWQALPLVVLARLHTEKQEWQTAERYIREARQVVGPAEINIVALLVESEAKLSLALGDEERAVRVVDESLSTIDRFQAHSHRAELLYYKGEALRRQGAATAAHDSLSEALALAEPRRLRRLLPLIWLALSRLEWEPTTAQRLRRQAAEMMQQIADSLPAEWRATFLTTPAAREVLSN
jgi:tetratricopeptide (TPR) repeat protein